ncbi:MAG: HNH endonuclease domain-containing protein, partial [Bacteroidales bacterium]
MKPNSLPYSYHLPVEHLAAVFSNVTNSYKYYWFLAILEYVKQGRQKIDIHDLIIEMIGEVWYPINYFRLSFGKWDRFDRAAQNIKELLGCSKEISKKGLIELLNENKRKPDIKQLITNLRRYVPMRFLTPWFKNELRGMKDQEKDSTIIKLAEQHFPIGKYVPYRFTDNQRAIEIDPHWFDYFSKHLSILTGFTEWHLVNFLQKNNPNVPNIPIKLFPPEKRDFKHARKFWNIYFNSNEHVYCIYSGKEITKSSYSLDHFLPWSFTGHDQLWNLIPTLKEVNSSKSDQLPAEKYLDHFISL